MYNNIILYPDPFPFIFPVYDIILHCFDDKTVVGMPTRSIYLQIVHLKSLVLGAYRT